MARKLFTLMLVVGLFASVISVAAALFTDSQAVDANAFTTGTLDLTTDRTTALVTFNNMAPGDQATAPIVVTNNGSLSLRYAISSVATDADLKGLMSQLDLTIKTGVTDCSNAGFATDGTVIYGPADLGSLTGLNLVGDPTTGGQAGDRTLAAAGAENLCFNVALPLATGNAFQDATTTATFTFFAEQTANN